MAVLNIVLVGNGDWGKNYIKTINEFFPEIKLTVANRDNWKLLIDKKPDGVIIATPPQSHIEIATYALNRNIKCLIEKPVALSLSEVKKLEVFEHVPILIGYIHLFSDPYQKIKQIVSGENITNITTEGSNLASLRDYSTLWDYGPHDLSMILDLTSSEPKNVNITKINNLYLIDMNFYNNLKTSSEIGKTEEKKRYLSIKFSGMQIIYDAENCNEKYTPPLINMLNVFFSDYPDNRYGLDLSVKISKILENYKGE